jgi:hypothetical protein
MSREKKRGKHCGDFLKNKAKKSKKKRPLKRFQKELKLTVEAHDIERLDVAVIEQGLQFFGGIRLKIKTRAPAPFPQPRLFPLLLFLLLYPGCGLWL